MINQQHFYASITLGPLLVIGASRSTTRPFPPLYPQVSYEPPPPSPPEIAEALQQMLVRAGVPLANHSRLQKGACCLLDELGAKSFVRTLRRGEPPLPLNTGALFPSRSSYTEQL